MHAAVLLVLVAWAQVSTPEQLFQQAVAAQARGDDAVAIRHYRELLKLRPDVMEARANLGAVLARTGRFDEAIEQYRAALAKDESNAALRLNLALAHYKKGDVPGAVEQLEIVRRAQPANLQASLLLADCHLRLGREAQVVALLKPLEAAHPQDGGLAWLLGSALIRNGQPRAGLDRVEKAARLGKNAEAWLLAGQTALTLNEFERARAAADAAFRLNPRLPGLLTLRGTALQYIGDNPGAIADLRKAVQTDPNDFEAQLTLGAVLFTERDLEGSARHLERAVQLNPSSIVARFQTARLQRTQGDLESARENLEHVIRADPAWAQPHLELSAVYFRLSRPADGERERAVFDRLNNEQQERERAEQKRSTAPRAR